MSAEKYAVVANTQIHYDGVVYGGGEHLPTAALEDETLIAYWLNAGWIESAPTKATRKR